MSVIEGQTRFVRTAMDGRCDEACYEMVTIPI